MDLETDVRTEYPIRLQTTLASVVTVEAIHQLCDALLSDLEVLRKRCETSDLSALSGWPFAIHRRRIAEDTGGLYVGFQFGPDEINLGPFEAGVMEELRRRFSEGAQGAVFGDQPTTMDVDGELVRVSADVYVTPSGTFEIGHDEIWFVMRCV